MAHGSISSEKVVPTQWNIGTLLYVIPRELITSLQGNEFPLRELYFNNNYKVDETNGYYYKKGGIIIS